MKIGAWFNRGSRNAEAEKAGREQVKEVVEGGSELGLQRAVTRREVLKLMGLAGVSTVLAACESYVDVRNNFRKNFDVDTVEPVLAEYAVEANEADERAVFEEADAMLKARSKMKFGLEEVAEFGPSDSSFDERKMIRLRDFLVIKKSMEKYGYEVREVNLGVEIEDGSGYVLKLTEYYGDLKILFPERHEYEVDGEWMDSPKKRMQIETAVYYPNVRVDEEPGEKGYPEKKERVYFDGEVRALYVGDEGLEEYDFGLAEGDGEMEKVEGTRKTLKYLAAVEGEVREKLPLEVRDMENEEQLLELMRLSLQHSGIKGLEGLMKRLVRYGRDKKDAGEEFFKHPLRAIQDGVADCDDYVMFAAMACKMFGYGGNLYQVDDPSWGNDAHVLIDFVDDTGNYHVMDNDKIYEGEGYGFGSIKEYYERSGKPHIKVIDKVPF